MWRRGAPQRRGARGAFRGADAHTSCYVTLRQLPMTKPSLSPIRCEMLTTLLTVPCKGGIIVV